MHRALQTILVSRKLAPTRKKAEAIARKYANRLYTSRKTKEFWRFRQRPPTCFSGDYKSKAIEDGAIVFVYATLKKDAMGRKICL